MGESTNPRAKLRFDRRVRLEFRGATITSDAGLLACRELDDALGLTETANECLQESRGGRNVQHRLVGLLRQSVYSRLAGYEDTNDAERLANDPTMRVVVGRRGGPERPAASTNTMSRFETEVLTQDGNVEGLDQLNAKWVDGSMSRTPQDLFGRAGRPGDDCEDAHPGYRPCGGCSASCRMPSKAIVNPSIVMNGHVIIGPRRRPRPSRGSTASWPHRPTPWRSRSNPCPKSPRPPRRSAGGWQRR